MLTIASTDSFPTAPGVYIMRGGDKTVLYVGKAKDLRKRVRSYFKASQDSRYHIRFLMQKVEEIGFIVTDTEKEALILENTLIKQYHPKYNINLRDDKTYFSLKMDLNEQYPRLSIVRKVSKDGARYFGPYSSAAAAKDVLKQLFKVFPLRHYPLETCLQRKRPCLFYQLKQCSAPCHGLISKEAYASLVEGASLFLEGKTTHIVGIFKKRMGEAAADARYEEAARFRDLIKAIEITVERQKMVDQGGDADAIGLFKHNDHLTITTLVIRGGTLTGSRNYSFSWEMSDEDGLASFLNEYYSQDQLIPATILLPITIAETAALEELLSEMSGQVVKIIVPRRGNKLDLVKLASKNAESAALESMNSDRRIQEALKILQTSLQVSRMPSRIECYDISNLQGKAAVGSRVVFRDGKPSKSEYRRYRIRMVDQADDYAMMREVLSRRFKQADHQEEYPDLIIVDGGIGQLNVLTTVLKELNVTGVATAGLAKSRVIGDMSSSHIERSEERIFLPGRKNPLPLRPNSAPLLLLASIRDEAHRFAVTYHKKLRQKELFSSELDSITGVGNAVKKSVLLHFGSLHQLKQASLDDFLELPGITKQKGYAIWKHFHQGKKEAAEPAED
jgi:excinuclease ABC subunit C